MVTLTFSALSSGFPLPCRQQDPQRAVPWSYSSSGGYRTRGSSQPLSQTAGPRSSRICGRKEGVQRHADVKQEPKHRTAPLFCCLHSTSPLDFTASAAPTNGRRPWLSTPAEQHGPSSTNTLILPAQTTPALCWDQTLIQTKWWGLYQGEAYLLTPANPFHTDQTAISLFTLSTTLLHRKPCLFSWENSVQAWIQILPADFHASVSPITEKLLQQTWAKLHLSEVKRIKIPFQSATSFMQLSCAFW